MAMEKIQNQNFVFSNNDSEFPVTLYGTLESPFFLASEIGEILGLANIRKNLQSIPDQFKVVTKCYTLGGAQSSTFIKEPALYMLAFKSHKKEAVKFTKWVCDEVLPTIRQNGVYAITKTQQAVKKYIKFNNKYNIYNETTLHYEIKQYLDRVMKERNIELDICVPLGENQKTKEQRFDSHRKGFQSGDPDFKITNKTHKYDGLCIELKDPKGSGNLEPEQEKMLKRYKKMNYKIVVSNDLIDIVHQIDKYMVNIRCPCTYCPKRFLSNDTRDRHYECFHKYHPSDDLSDSDLA